MRVGGEWVYVGGELDSLRILGNNTIEQRSAFIQAVKISDKSLRYPSNLTPKTQPPYEYDEVIYELKVSPEKEATLVFNDYYHHLYCVSTFPGCIASSIIDYDYITSITFKEKNISLGSSGWGFYVEIDETGRENLSYGFVELENNKRDLSMATDNNNADTIYVSVHEHGFIYRLLDTELETIYFTKLNNHSIHVTDIVFANGVSGWMLDKNGKVYETFDGLQSKPKQQNLTPKIKRIFLSANKFTLFAQDDYDRRNWMRKRLD